ncbi:MAG: D-alanyl-D-alanine carboxypeptidase/D-alanyl-D-alanine-endopeptidase [Bryobacteraceae bacterium]
MFKTRVVSVVLTLSGALWAGDPDSVWPEKVRPIVERPAFRHAEFGIAVYSIPRQKFVYRSNADKLFVPGSTTKLLTVGTALHLLGADYRFRTRMYRTGKLENGTLHGDLVLVASGDPNLSNRIQRDGTLAFEDHDHSYGGDRDTKAVPGDPLAVLREMARQVADRGIREVDGRVLVDAGLYPEGTRELGTGVVVSPVMVNDNVVDVTVVPGASDGAAATLRISPDTPYVTFTSAVKTGAPGSKTSLDFGIDSAEAGGVRKVTLTGSIPAGGQPLLIAYPVPQPSRFAEVAFEKVLKDAGVRIVHQQAEARPKFDELSSSYTEGNLVAEHVSPPLAEEAKVTLKVSQNLHASAFPYLLGALIGKKKPGTDQAGFDAEREFLQNAGLDLTAAMQSDGAGGAAMFTPEFMVSYLLYMSKQPEFGAFFRGLPVLGRDGTLARVLPDSPAAGHVFAKTGTYAESDMLNRRLMITGKGLAGFIDARSGERFAFAAYVNRVSVAQDDPDAITIVAAGALGEIAAVFYDSSNP